MSDVFVSYKREDEARIGRLVQALERRGFSVWWDRGLPGGEGWRAGIEAALAEAGCVIVAWTEASVGPHGDFVRDEAARAKARGVLVPVLLDGVVPPLGFGELQAIDLARWKGSARDPFFGDLCATIRARLDHRPPPPATAPMKRLVRRMTYSGIATLLAIAAGGFAVNALGAQDGACAASPLQPFASDACGALGLGHRPSRTERLAWSAHQAGSCTALREHLARFPDGAYRELAAGMLAARTVTDKEEWLSTTRRLALFVGQDTVAATDEAARAAALDRGRQAAARLCGGFAATGSFRLTSATSEPAQWQCDRTRGGVSCGFEGAAACALEERTVAQSETCGN
jgi:hypothetical protein